MWGERSFLRYRGEWAEGKSHPVPRNIGVLSSLTEQRGRFFPCHKDDTDDNYDEWAYAPLHRRGKERTLGSRCICVMRSFLNIVFKILGIIELLLGVSS